MITREKALKESFSNFDIVFSSNDVRTVSTALASLFSKWCGVNYTEPYKFNDKKIFDGKCNFSNI